MYIYPVGYLLVSCRNDYSRRPILNLGQLYFCHLVTGYFTHFVSLITPTPWLTLWQYGLWSFQTGDTKLERFLPKNQHTQRKLLNFEFWNNGELSKSAKVWLSKPPTWKLHNPYCHSIYHLWPYHKAVFAPEMGIVEKRFGCLLSRR